MKEACHRSFLGAEPRLVESFYEVIAYTDEKSQNHFCEAIKQKKGKILDLDFKYEFNMT